MANGATVRKTTEPVQIAATIEIHGCGRSWEVAWLIPAATARDPPNSASNNGSLGSTRTMQRRYVEDARPRLVLQDESAFVLTPTKTGPQTDPEDGARCLAS